MLPSPLPLRLVEAAKMPVASVAGAAELRGGHTPASKPRKRYQHQPGFLGRPACVQTPPRSR